MPVVPPVRVRVYFEFAASAGVGLTIHRLATVVSLVTVVAITPPAGPFSTTVDVVTFVTGSLKVTRMLPVLANPVALMAGVRLETVGATVSPAGAAGAGVTAVLAVDSAPVPAELIAATLKVYAVLLVRAVTFVVRTLPTGTVLTTVVPVRTWTL